MKFITQFILVLLTNLCYPQSGSLDNTFGDGGKLLCVRGFYNTNFSSIETTPTGEILLLANGRITQYNSDGSLDKTFGENGIIITDAQAFIVRTDGKIITCSVRDKNRILIACYHATGGRDVNFGKNGFSYIRQSLTNEFGWIRLFLLPEMKVLITHNLTKDYGPVELHLFDKEGKSDINFGNNGTINTGLSVLRSNQYIHYSDIDSTIYVSSRSYHHSNNESLHAIKKYSYNGVLLNDYKFSIEGLSSFEFLISQNSFFIFKEYYGYSSLKRYYIDGLIDTTFADGGEAKITVDEITGFINDIFIKNIQKDILMAVNPKIFSANEVCLIKLDEKGRMVSEFGHNGYVLTAMSEGFGWGGEISYTKPTIFDMKIQPDGKILVLATKELEGKSSDLYILRYLP